MRTRKSFSPKESREPDKSFNPVELEQAFDRAYMNYGVSGRSGMDVDTFFDRIRQNLIELISRELTDLNSARVQTTTWIRFGIEYEDGIIDRVRSLFFSWMTNIFQDSHLNEIMSGMFCLMKTQIENPALANSRFIFNEVLFIDINFHQLNLTRGSSYIPLPDWVSRKGGVISPKNENDEECFKWAVIAALHHEEIRPHPERNSNLARFEDNYDLGRLKFPLPIKGISEFEKRNDVSVNVLGVDVIINVLGVEENKVYQLRRSKYESGEKVINLLLMSQSIPTRYILRATPGD